jgi:hypothetical protein
LKKHLSILGGIYTLTCGLALALGLTLCLVLWADPGNRAAVELIGPPFLLGSCLALVPGLIGGIGLLYFRPWARVVLLLPSLLFLFVVPIGTVIGIYGLWILLNAKTVALLTGGGEDAPEGPSSPGSLLSFFAVMACVAAGFFMVLKIGFLIHGDPLPPPLESRVLTGVAATVLVAGFAAMTVRIIQYVGTAVVRARIRREANVSARFHREARRLRVAELAADPARARYAPLVEKGEEWTEENIAYYEDPGDVITCVHLQPIEGAMRRAGVDLRRYRKAEVVAKCHIDDAALQRDFTIAPPVRYAEFYQAERYEFDHPTALLICDEHKSMIHVLHPEESGTGEVPVFPAAEGFSPAV